MADQGKTEKASPRRRQKAREQGQVARSRDLTAGLSAMTAVVFCAWQMPAFAGDWRGLLRQELVMAATHPEQFVPVWRHGMSVFRGVVLAAGMSWVVATVGGLAQGGLVFAPTALTPNWKRLDPASHVEQLFSLGALSRLAEIAFADDGGDLFRHRRAGARLAVFPGLAARQPHDAGGVCHVAHV